jgi:hypothetical protein
MVDRDGRHGTAGLAKTGAGDTRQHEIKIGLGFYLGARDLNVFTHLATDILFERNNATDHVTLTQPQQLYPPTTHNPCLGHFTATQEQPVVADVVGW